MKALDKLKVLLSIVKGKFSEVESDRLRTVNTLTERKFM